jgi:acyl-[acyl-carrier-protein]-phospholipid O-acyltransferase/long-chain-fatty-acid--[acyl-carrier-protein] ligase
MRKNNLGLKSMQSPLSFTKNKPFWALFVTQFLGAFNDNFFRTAFITLLTYHFVGIPEESKAMFVSAAFGVFMTPFFLFSPLAGQLADRFSKARIIQWVKGAEILIVAFSSFGFVYQNPYFLLISLFCMGTHSAIFGPAKYALLPELIPEKALLKGNGYIEAGAFFAVMGGTLIGALMIHNNISPLALCGQIFFIACLGFCVSLGLSPNPTPKIPFTFQFSWLKQVRQLYRVTQQDPQVFKATIGLAWFWLVGALLLAQLPPLAKEILNVQESVFIFFLFLFTLGVGTGSMVCHWVFRGEITTKYTPLLALLMIPALFDLASFTSPLAEVQVSLEKVLSMKQGLRFMLDIFSLSLLGGLFVVPLYTFLQARVASRHLSQVVAFSNIMIAGFMVFVSFISSFLLSLGFSIPFLIKITAVGQSIMALYMIGILPKETLSTFSTFFKAIWKNKKLIND